MFVRRRHQPLLLLLLLLLLPPPPKANRAALTRIVLSCKYAGDIAHLQRKRWRV